jgi:hypothetical protein
LNVIVGTPVCREGAYALDKFLANQKQIQVACPTSELVLTTSEQDFRARLEQLVQHWEIRGRVLSHDVVKPDYARSRIWDITCGREAIRSYLISQTAAQELLFLDADMTYDPEVIRILQKEMPGYDVVFSGYYLKNHGVGLAGVGCALFTRQILEKIQFRCFEFKNGEVIFEDNLVEVDAFLRGKIKRGFFLAINHYLDSTQALRITPRRIGLFRGIANNTFVRYGLIKASTVLHYNIPWKIKVLLNDFGSKTKTSAGSDLV